MGFQEVFSIPELQQLCLTAGYPHLLLYMLLVYEIDELYNRHIATLVHWAKLDSPSAWEVAYNNWVYSRLGIRNPFIDTPENALQLLDNRGLLASIEYRQ